jgi:hypothetical protein
MGSWNEFLNKGNRQIHHPERIFVILSEAKDRSGMSVGLDAQSHHQPDPSLRSG